MTIDELTKQAMRLTPEARAHLARELLGSLDSLSESEVEKLWLEVAAHRDAERPVRFRLETSSPAPESAERDHSRLSPWRRRPRAE
jgi:hypothetical protein